MVKYYEVPPTEAAVDQIDWAIRLFLDHKAYVPAITLAGAARGILEQILKEKGDADTAFNSIRTLLSQKGLGEPDVIGKFINGPRNFLKHADQSSFDSNAADLQSIAIYEIVLAIGNLLRLDRSVTSETMRFLEWTCTNRTDVHSD